MGGLEEWKLRLTSAKVEVELEAELGKNLSSKMGEGCRLPHLLLEIPTHERGC